MGRRSPLEDLNVRRRMFEMIGAGVPYLDIAKELKVSVATIVKLRKQRADDDVKFTKEGVKVGFKLITWEQIDAGRDQLKHP